MQCACVVVSIASSVHRMPAPSSSSTQHPPHHLSSLPNPAFYTRKTRKYVLRSERTLVSLIRAAHALSHSLATSTLSITPRQVPRHRMGQWVSESSPWQRASCHGGGRTLKTSWRVVRTGDVVRSEAAEWEEVEVAGEGARAWHQSRPSGLVGWGVSECVVRHVHWELIVWFEMIVCVV